MRITSLTKKNDFTRIFRAGKRIQFDCFTLFVKKNNMPYPRFAFITPVSLDKRAVFRNTLRRRAREYIRRKKELLEKSFDAVFLFKKCDFLHSRKHLYECLGKALLRL